MLSSTAKTRYYLVSCGIRKTAPFSGSISQSMITILICYRVSAPGSRKNIAPLWKYRKSPHTHSPCIWFECDRRYHQIQSARFVHSKDTSIPARSVRQRLFLPHRVFASFPMMVQPPGWPGSFLHIPSRWAKFLSHSGFLFLDISWCPWYHFTVNICSLRNHCSTNRIFVSRVF